MYIFSHLQIIKHCYQLNNNKNKYFPNTYTRKRNTKFSRVRFKQIIALQ